MQKVCFKKKHYKNRVFEGCLFFKEIKNGSLIANFETPQNAFLETNSVLNGLKLLFFYRKCFFYARFCARFWGDTLIGRKWCTLFCHSLERERRKNLKLLLSCCFCCFSCCCRFVVVVVVLLSLSLLLFLL